MAPQRWQHGEHGLDGAFITIRTGSPGSFGVRFRRRPEDRRPHRRALIKVPASIVVVGNRPSIGLMRNDSGISSAPSLSPNEISQGSAAVGWQEVVVPCHSSGWLGSLVAGATASINQP